MKRLALFAFHFLLAIALMLVFRAVGMTVCTVEGNALSPSFIHGDRVLVNRWSYGLRVAGGTLFGYGRIWRQKVERGDLIAFEHPQTGQMLVCQCKALPGDTIHLKEKTIVIPSLKQCADSDYYYMQSPDPSGGGWEGALAEEHIIGRVVMVICSHHPDSALWKGWNPRRLFKPC